MAWWFAAGTVVALATAPLIAPTLGMSVWLATGTVLFITFLLYVSLNAPPRYRWFGWGQSRQAVDHEAGRFGGTYPEDRSGLGYARRGGRNERCPCGSGHKYKHCCGA